MSTSRISGDLRIDGDLQGLGEISCQTLSIPAGTIVDADVNAAAAIGHTKLEHQHRITYGQNGTVAADTRVIFVCRGTSGEVVAVKAGCIGVESGGNSCTVDVQKNGTSVLTGAITLDSGDSPYTPEAGTLKTDGTEDLVADDVLTVVIATSSSDATGVYVVVTVREDAS
jgi:hypothetical protein